MKLQALWKKIIIKMELYFVFFFMYWEAKALVVSIRCRTNSLGTNWGIDENERRRKKLGKFSRIDTYISVKS